MAEAVKAGSASGSDTGLIRVSSYSMVQAWQLLLFALVHSKKAPALYTSKQVPIGHGQPSSLSRH